MADVVCVGCSCTDVLIRGVDLSTPFTSESKRCEQTMLSVGGDAANEAIVMAKLGVDVKLVTGIGDDGIAAYIEKTAEDAGVDISALQRIENSPTCMNVIVVHPDGQRNFINRGFGEDTVASMFIEPDLKELEGAGIVSLASMMIPPLHKRETILRAARTAKEMGALVCADVIFNPESSGIEDIRDALEYVDYIFPNEDEAAALTGKTDLDEIADIFLGYGVKNVIIKLGKDGCFVKNSEKRLFIPSFEVDAIDTTGAGDNFAAGFITALNEGKTLEDCCMFASATAGIACTTVGASTGIQNRRQVEEFLENNKPGK